MSDEELHAALKIYGWFLNCCKDGTYQLKDQHTSPDDHGPFISREEALAWAKQNPNATDS